MKHLETYGGARKGRTLRNPELTAKWLRYAAVALFAVSAFVAAGAAVIGKVPGVPVWVAAGGAGVAALAAAFLPQLVTALKERQRASEAVVEATARLKPHLEAVRSRYADHLQVAGLERAELAGDGGGSLERVVRVRSRPGVDKSDRPEATKSESQLGVLEDFAAGDGGRMIVLGEGGLGKTTSLLRLAAQAAERAKRDPSAPIPIWIELKNFDVSEHGFERLLKMAANSILGMDEQGFDAVWRLGSRRLLFLLDGLNEQSGSSTACAAGLRELTSRAPHTYVVTSRPTAEVEALTAFEEGFLVLELLPLGQREIRLFLATHGLEWLYEQMDDDLRGLARNPFMLVALGRSSAAPARAELPRNVGQLYRRFIDEYVFKEREPRRGLVEYDYSGIKRPVLAWLARRMTSASTTVIRHDRALEGETERELERALAESRRLTTRRKFVPVEWDGAGLLAEVIANGVLRSNDGNLEFMHESIQEYFTAVGLESAPAEAAARARPLVWRHVELSRVGDAGAADPYRVPLLMLAGLLETGDALVQALAARDALLGAECVRAAGSLEPSTRARLRDVWLALLDRAHERYRRIGTACLAAARLSDDEITHKLIDLAIDDPVYEVQRGAEDALQLLGIGACAPYLAEKMERPGRYDRATELLASRS